MFQRLHRDDRGIAMLMSLSVMLIAMILALVAVKITVSTNQDSGHNRQRVTAVAAAEAGLDQTFALMQSSGTSLPCSSSGAVATGTVTGASDNPSYSVTVTYLGSSGSPLTCAQISAGSVPAQAVIRSTASPQRRLAGTVPAVRTMESLVRLTPLRDSGFNTAIYGSSGLTFQQHATITGNSGADANLYTNANFTCKNNQSYAGSVYSQGSIDFQQCSAQGELWAKAGISVSNNASVGGNVSTSTGNATLSSNASVVGTVKAGGSVSWSNCTATKCISNATVAAPPIQPFPKLYDGSDLQAQWANQLGFTTILTTQPNGSAWSCTASDDSNPSNWIVHQASTLTAPTQLHTSCAVTFSNMKTVKLANDLAVFAAGGISSSHQATWDSTSSAATRKLYWVVPISTSYSTDCNAPGISTDQNFATADSVDMMLYAQGPISFSNNGTHIGQIYSACTVTIGNNFNLQYRPMPIAGVDPSSAPVQSYAVDVAYTREVH